ncbi:MAG: YncE family protein [Caulobacterales bacterium]
MKILMGVALASVLVAMAGASSGAPATVAAKTYPVVGQIPAGDSFWDYATYIPAEHRLYVSREDGLTVYDSQSGQVTNPLIAGHQVHSIVPLSGGRALITNGADNTAVIFERATGKPLITIPTGRKPDGAGLDPKTGQLIIMDGTDDDAVFADPKTGKVLGHLPLGGEPGSPMFDGRGHAFSNIADHSEIAVIDMASHKVLKRYPLPDCADASGLGLDQASGVLLSTCAGLKAVATDSRTGKILGTVPIGKYPDAVVTDPLRHVFYVPTIAPGELTVVGLGKGGVPQVLAKVTVAPGVHTGALDAQNGRLYLPAGDLQLVRGQRPSVAPGTFRIMVIDVN